MDEWKVHSWWTGLLCRVNTTGTTMRNVPARAVTSWVGECSGLIIPACIAFSPSLHAASHVHLLTAMAGTFEPSQFPRARFDTTNRGRCEPLTLFAGSSPRAINRRNCVRDIPIARAASDIV